MLAILIAAITIVALLVVRTITAHRDERESASRLPVGADGIIPGAEPFELAGRGDRAVLLLHGFGDTPQTLRYLAAALNARGWTVRAPLLPGHGRTLREFAASGAADWIDCARHELDTLESRFSVVAVCGLSMGGAISLIIAAESPELPAMVLLAPFLGMRPVIRRLAAMHRLIGAVATYFATRGERSIRDPAEAARALGYGYTTARLLDQLAHVVRHALDAAPRVMAPTLLVQSRDDNRIPPSVASSAFDRIGARDKHLEWITGAGHVITVDYGREHVFQLTADWLDQWATADTDVGETESPERVEES